MTAACPPGCAQEDHLATGPLQASARIDYVHLDGVDYFLKEDIAGVAPTNNQSLPFSAQLRAALKTFLASNLWSAGTTAAGPPVLQEASAPVSVPHSPDRRRTRKPEEGVRAVLACTVTRHFALALSRCGRP